MQKIACLFSFKESNWVSCQKIVFNLHQSYEGIENAELGNFHYPHELIDPEGVLQTAKNILHFDPDVIAIMDHRPHPLSLFQALAPLYKDRRKPKIIFHLFGDFTIYYSSWEMMEPLLEGFQVEFLVASDRQKILVDRMFEGNKSIVCPFPVNPQEFHFSDDLRRNQRQAWGVGDEDVVFLFTGRLSRQKRIRTLISTFAEALAGQPRAHLFLYGLPDNIGDPFLQKIEIEGEYFSKFFQAYKTLPETVRERIHFKGSLPNHELLSVYAGADVLTNLSVHNDEDYGMSVAEAQLTGLPSILTDWGGLASFAHPELPEATRFVPVTITPTTKKIDRRETIKAMTELFHDPRRELRPVISELATARFSIQTVRAIVTKTIENESSPFLGYTKLFRSAVFSSLIGSFRPMYLNKHCYINNLYKEIYSAYVRCD